MLTSFVAAVCSLVLVLCLQAWLSARERRHRRERDTHSATTWR